MLGTKPHQRVEALVEARIIEEATDSSYEKTTRPFGLSRQKAMISVRGLEEIEDKEVKILNKKKIEYLYIEADEDHVSLQKGGTAFPQIIYVHEELQEVAGKDERHKLQNVKYVAGEYKGNWEVWRKVYDYISANYDIEYIKKVYISGDGAVWIKEGVYYIEKSIFVLDRYHLNEYILKAAGHVKDMRFKLWDAINRCDKREV